LVKLASDLSESIALLNSHRVEYLIVGGHAVAYHGHPRVTGDVDFLLRPNAENANRVIAALGDFGFGALALKAADLTVPRARSDGSPHRLRREILPRFPPSYGFLQKASMDRERIGEFRR
jgi:hypothetical protein